jgi:hypothetical protein
VINDYFFASNILTCILKALEELVNAADFSKPRSNLINGYIQLKAGAKT